MPAYIDQSFEQFHNPLHVSNLPADVTAKRITDLFERFGTITKLYLKRRISKDSPISLRNPFVILIFESRTSIDKVMDERPYFMNDHQLLVRRYLPVTRRYPYERYLNTNKILIRIPREYPEKILPNDNIIMNYLQVVGGEILRFERFEEQTVLVEFNDYDPVDICCLSRPHIINDQLIEIEKCRDEQSARRRAEFRQKSRFVSLKLSSTLLNSDVDIQSCEKISLTPTLHISEQLIQIQSTYDEINKRLEDEHEQLISSLKAEWEQIATERIRLQRLTLDYKYQLEYLIRENQRCTKLYSECLEEDIHIQKKDEHKLHDATRKYLTAKTKFDQLIQNTK